MNAILDEEKKKTLENTLMWMFLLVKVLGILLSTY